jgi:hypothetical protein
MQNHGKGSLKRDDPIVTSWILVRRPDTKGEKKLWSERFVRYGRLGSLGHVMLERRWIGQEEY